VTVANAAVDGVFRVEPCEIIVVRNNDAALRQSESQVFVIIRADQAHFGRRGDIDAAAA
jgi:hypothetical protein